MIFDRATVCDATLPFVAGWEGQDEILDRYHRLGIAFLSLTIANDMAGPGAVVRHIADLRARIEASPQKFLLVRTVEDIREAKRSGRLGLGFNFQGTAALESDPKMMALYHELGLLQVLLVYNTRNSAADGCMEESNAGLSRLGFLLVAEMNRLGILVDASHTGYRSTMDMFEASTAPVIFSHSNAAAVHAHRRNIRDDQIKACAKTGGIICLTGVGSFLSPAGTSLPELFVPHARHIAELVGPRHLGIGIDNVYFQRQLEELKAANPHVWPAGTAAPSQYFEPEQLPALADTLLGAGFDDDEVIGILGENYLRVAGEVCRPSGEQR